MNEQRLKVVLACVIFVLLVVYVFSFYRRLTYVP